MKTKEERERDFKERYDLWLKNNNKLGGQYKVPRLLNNRTIVEEILTQIMR